LVLFRLLTFFLASIGLLTLLTEAAVKGRCRERGPLWILRAELAKIAGVSRAAITQQCQRSLGRASRGKLLDLHHDAVRDFLLKHGVDPDGAPTSITISGREFRPEPTTSDLGSACSHFESFDL
jgi:hypothetical protein